MEETPTGLRLDFYCLLQLTSKKPPFPKERMEVFTKLKIRYDETVQTLDLDEKATEQLWISLSLEGKGLSDSEKEQKIQEAFDIQYNRPEYNS